MAGEAVLSIVLEGLLSKLSSPILDEFGLLWGVEKEKQKLESNLKRIKAVLEDAGRQQIDLMAEKDRLGKLKDVAYDAEDLVDEFIVEALRRKVENQDGMGRKVGFFSPANPIAFRFKIAHKMKELRERFDELHLENTYFPLPVGVASSQPQISTPRETSSAMPDTGVQGRDDVKKQLIDSLLYSGNEEVLSVIPIVGMGGLGKTTLAQFLYSHERVVTHFGLRMWVYVSDRDFHVKGVLGNILGNAIDDTSDQLEQLQNRVREKLSGKRYLLVLDDVWNVDYEKWERLRTVLNCGARGSKILVTTRNDTVARTMDALPGPPLKILSTAESWTLFEKVAHPPTDFESIGTEIVRKCGGVPLAIKTLGGMLRNETGKRKWELVRDSELWKTQDQDGGILPALRLSYDHLTSSLKQCFAYCAVIPKGHRFNKDELIKQWIAQGFIHSDNENELLEEGGETCFNALLQRSLFQVDVETYSNDEYKMHDLIHDLLRSVAGKECSVVKGSMMNDLTRHLELFNDETRHLALWNDYRAGELKNLDALKKCKKLRSMITYGYGGHIDINVCLSFRCLRVLDLSSRRSIHFLPNSIDKLRHLRYFDISYTEITELPETICNLHNLQTLRVLGIRLQKWPKNMKRMISLRHLELYRREDAMAGAAVLSIVLEGLLSKLSSPILDEFGLLWGVKKEKQKLQSNLSRIKALLQDAERQQIDLMTDKDRLGKLKNVAYDAEDLVDEFLVEAQRRKVENQDGMGRKVGNFFSPANPIAFRFKIAHKMKELRERFDELAEENNNFQLPEGVARSQPRISTTRETASNVPDSGVRGRDYEKENLIDSLINSGNEEVLSVIPIVGMGGLGKTTLAQFVYDDERVVTHFNLKMWVYVSEDFDVGRILAKILQSATKKSTPTDGSSKDLLINRVKENLSGKRYLLVLDDVWNEDYQKWVELRTVLQRGARGSKILVTTRSDTVARRMDAVRRPPLETLSAAESWTLFEKVAHPPTSLVSIGKDIVRKCGGVPLAIKTLGGMLRNEREWQSVRDSELWKRRDNGGILSILRLSYDHLIPSLKQCFAYCIVIPKGRRFNKDELIKQWIAQGFIHSDDGNELLEEEGEKYFNALSQRFMFQVDVEPFRNDKYRMHDLIHDLLRSVAGKECLVVEASMMNDFTRHLALRNDEIRHLALCNDDWDDEWAGETKNLDALKKCKKLRSMITHGSIDINVCLSFRCLRVLDLSRRSIHFLPNSIDKLRHLRYFDISYTLITELPETICNLHDLQTLRALGIPLQKLPKNMKRMISLRHIEFDKDDDLPLPEGIGDLTSLRTLPKSKFIIAKESGARIEELKDLNLLWGNIHIGGLENIGSVECAGEADLKAKKHLSSLKLSWSGNETVAAEGKAKEVIEILEPHSDLKELSVENYTGLGFPSWMMKKLTNLKKISLSSCKRCEQLPPLGQLGFLESLEIDTMDAVKHIVEFDGSHNYNDFFPSLKDLHLRNMPNLEGWSSPQEDGDDDEQGRETYNQMIFKCLRSLKIHDCPKLARQPRLLLPALEELDMSKVGCESIEFSRSHSLKRVDLLDMPNLERWSLQEVDDDKDEQVTFHSLRTLGISKCPKLICMRQFLLPALEKLEMKGVGCEKIEFSASKSVLEISDSCEKQTSLPGDGIVLPSLKELRIDSCKNIESLSADMLKNLTQLSISDSPKVWSSLVSLENLKSLESLSISGCPESTMMKLLESMENLTSITSLSISDCPTDMRPLPKSVKICTSLTFLRIEGCPGMRSLPEWVGDLTLLRDLRILFCPAMMSLPEGLQRLQNLKSLFITGCPVLERRAQRNKGQDWHKVAHVRYISLGGGINIQDTEGEESSDQSPHLLLH